MHACVMLQIQDPWALQPRVCHRLILHIVRYVGCVDYNTRCEAHRRGAMQWQWLMQIDSPKVRIIRGRRELHLPSVTFRPDKAVYIDPDEETAREWGQCPQR